MAATPKPVGVIGGRVAGNLRGTRREVSTYELERRLRDIGWPIASSGITRIESGERRVSVDDVVALAVVLGVTPNQLMFPAMASRPGVTYGVPLVGTVVAQDTDIWAWATGDSPLVVLEDGERGEEPSSQDVAAFMLANRPHLLAQVDVDRVDDVVEALAGGLRLALERGADIGQLRGILDRAITEAAFRES